MNLGQYLAGGAPIVSLQSLNPIYANFGVPQQDAGKVRIGGTVRITANDVTGIAGIEFRGRVTAIDSTVSEAPRNIQVQATLSKLATEASNAAPVNLVPAAQA